MCSRSCFKRAPVVHLEALRAVAGRTRGGRETRRAGGGVKKGGDGRGGSDLSEATEARARANAANARGARRGARGTRGGVAHRVRIRIVIGMASRRAWRGRGAFWREAATPTLDIPQRLTSQTAPPRATCRRRRSSTIEKAFLGRAEALFPARRDGGPRAPRARGAPPPRRVVDPRRRPGPPGRPPRPRRRGRRDGRRVAHARFVRQVRRHLVGPHPRARRPLLPPRRAAPPPRPPRSWTADPSASRATSTSRPSAASPRARRTRTESSAKPP